jgi:hypothetical protein
MHDYRGLDMVRKAAWDAQKTPNQLVGGFPERH